MSRLRVAHRSPYRTSALKNLKRTRAWFAFVLMGALTGVLASGQNPSDPQKAVPPNYDETKVGQYSLPDPLTLINGERSADAQSWYQFRRPEILNLFSTYVHGRTPAQKLKMSCEPSELSEHALGGTAVRKQVTCSFGENEKVRKMDILIYLPAGAQKPVPLFLGLNFGGNQTVNADPGIKLATVWDRNKKTRLPAEEKTRGSWDQGWQVEKVIGHGYGIASIYYGDIDPDFPGGIADGVRPLFFAPGQSDPAPDDWGAIGAWAWGLSRALDYLETEKAVDFKRVALVGHSRLGKTVLWAGAQDTRFALVIASCSGRSGASLARRNFGETVEHMVEAFPQQFALNYQRYGDNTSKLPVDTHELLALIAPRPVLLATGSEEPLV